MSKRVLTPAQHIHLGRTLKHANALLLDAARYCRIYGRLADHLYDCADALVKPRSFLEKRLIEEVGDDALISGVHVRDVYFGNTSAMEEVDG
jgi:hypothetical protein